MKTKKEQQIEEQINDVSKNIAELLYLILESDESYITLELANTTE